MAKKPKPVSASFSLLIIFLFGFIGFMINHLIGSSDYTLPAIIGGGFLGMILSTWGKTFHR
jgi:hypothetical protein